MRPRGLVGVVAGAALLGGLAFAGQDTLGAGGSGLERDRPHAQGSTPSSQAPMKRDVGSTAGNQLMGTVVESKSHTLYLQHMGAVVPVRVDQNTDLKGLAGKAVSDLKPGDEVQVSFTVKNRIDNVATRISAMSGMGGSGFDASEQSRDMGRNSGLGGSGSAGAGGSVGEDTNVGHRPISPEEKPMMQPHHANPADNDKPIY